MKTEHEISSAISKYVSSQQGVTDFPVTLKQVSDEVDTLRVRLISELDSKGGLIRPFYNFTQTLNLGEVDIKIDQTNVRQGQSRLRYIQTPRIYTLSSGRLAIAYCGAADGGSNGSGGHFRIVHGLQREWYGADRWIGRAPTAVVIELPVGGYRIEFHNVTPNKLRFVAVFEDPSDLEPWGYNPKTSLYPMPSGMVDVIIGKTAESYLRTMYRVPLQSNQTVDAPTTPKPTV